MILSLTLTIQAKNMQSSQVTLNPIRRINSARELKQVRNESEQLIQELNQLEERLREYQYQDTNDLSAVNYLTSDLQRYQILAGYKAVEGPGVSIILMEYQSINEQGSIEIHYLKYHLDLILALISELNSTGAEAIAINGLRYTSNTEIIYESNQLFINSTPVTLPIIIDAIGNQQSLESILNMRFRIAYYIKENRSIIFSYSLKDQLRIPGHGELPVYEFAKPQLEE